MNKDALRASLLLPIAVAMPAPAEWLNGRELHGYCREYLRDAKSAEGGRCVAFLQGFLAGTSGTWTWSEPAAEDGETFADRAARTRVGSRLNNLELERSGAWCIGEDVSAESVIERVTEHLGEHADERGDTAAEELVALALGDQFPCREE